MQIVTSAFRPIPAQWANCAHLIVAVSIDGLAPEHDVRHAPATYERILKNIAGQHIVIHCTITGQTMNEAAGLPALVSGFLDAAPGCA
ncbi:MAG: hypothetical protein FJW31_03230 [Acidobacteria bacterium]|nr:hypothetical protein [Acidobacteriota bacterium]